jgi:colicin import membrane protein
MVVELSIHLLPSGEVDDAYVSKSSGDDRFDRDAVRAVMKASSFPELRKLDPVVFDRYYRKFTMVFRPEDLRR